MIIRHLGHASFRINLKDGTSIVTDPYDENVGFAMPSTPADIVTISHEHHDHNFIGQLAPKHVIRGTEQAQFSGLTIEGFATFHDDVSGAKRGKNTVYLFEAEGLRVLHLGDLGHMPGDDLIENLLPIDVLMIPVGGVFTIDAEMAAELTHRFLT